MSTRDPDIAWLQTQVAALLAHATANCRACGGTGNAHHWYPHSPNGPEYRACDYCKKLRGLS